MGDVRHPVAYYSCKLTQAEKNYPTREQELLGIREALRVWKHYLHGVPSVHIETDHASLQYIRDQRDLSGRLARWNVFSVHTTLMKYATLK